MNKEPMSFRFIGKDKAEAIRKWRMTARDIHARLMNDDDSGGLIVPEDLEALILQAPDQFDWDENCIVYEFDSQGVYWMGTEKRRKELVELGRCQVVDWTEGMQFAPSRETEDHVKNAIEGLYESLTMILDVLESMVPSGDGRILEARKAAFVAGIALLQHQEDSDLAS